MKKYFKSLESIIRKYIVKPIVAGGLLWILNGCSGLHGPDIEWEKTYSRKGIDLGYSVQETRDKGYIVAGVSNAYSEGNRDIHLFKIDTLGNKIWEKTYGGRKDDEGLAIKETMDSGYIIAGWTNSLFSSGSGEEDIYLVKTDSSGNPIWEKNFGGIKSDHAYDVCEVKEGGYVVAGSTSSFGNGKNDLYLIKTDSLGNRMWEKTYGGKEDDFCYAVQETLDGYILAGATESFGKKGFDVFLIKTDPHGNKLWEKTFGGEGDDRAYSVVDTGDGYALLGNTDSFHSQDIYIIKTDTLGNKIWEKTYGGKGQETGSCIQKTRDGGFIITGTTNSFRWLSRDSDFYLLKIDSQGNKIWEQIYGRSKLFSTEGKNDGSLAVQETSDKGYIAVGSTGSGHAEYMKLETKSLEPKSFKALTIYAPVEIVPCHKEIDAKSSLGGGDIDYDIYLIKLKPYTVQEKDGERKK